MQRNLKLFPWYQMLTDAMAWMPVFFLYFSQHLPLPEVVRLAALYYVAVVTLEVPSGYFSDRMGRRVTLLCSAVAFAGAYAMYIAAHDFAAFAFGQLALAMGMAFRSGTDVAFHYETLYALGRQREYPRREARVKRLSLSASALAVTAGGMLGSFDLVYAYWLSLAAALGALMLALMFREPRDDLVQQHPAGFIRQLGLCAGYLKNPLLGWLFLFYIVAFVLAHVPYEFYQPYLGLLESRDLLADMSAPVVSGLILGCTMLLGAWIAGHSVTAQQRLGLGTLLLLAVTLQTLVIGVMGLWLNVAVVGVLMLRNIPMAMVHAPINGAVAPRIDGRHRATYLSMQSLAARLGFGVTLYIASLGIDVDRADWPTLSLLLKTYAAFGVLTVALLWVSRRFVAAD